MTNYNERLDEILGRIISQESSREGGWAEFFAGTKEYLEAAPYGNPLEKQQELKQAITSLIKELVAEAKPAKEIGAPVGKYETGGECNAYADGSNEAAEQFEQNLLKALEEV